MAAAQKLYPQARVSRIVLPARQDQPYDIRVRQPDEIAEGGGATRVTLDARSQLAPAHPRSLDGLVWRALSGLAIPLHSGQAFGVAGRSFITRSLA